MAPRANSLATLLLAALLSFAASSCGDDDNNDGGGVTAPPPNQPGGTQQMTVRIQPGAATMGSDAYGTNPLRVSPGTTITWVNDDSMPHTVTSTSGLFDSESLATGEQFSFTFTDPGTFTYFCEIHPNMTGAVEVDGTTTTTTPGTPTTTSTTLPPNTSTTTTSSTTTTTTTMR